MSTSRVWLDVERVLDRNMAFPDQRFTSVEYTCTDRECEAILDFSEKIRQFERWCRSARQTMQVGGEAPPVPEFLTTPVKKEAAPSGKATTRAKRAQKAGEE